MPRLFFAVWPDPTEQDRILAYAEACAWNGAKRVRAGQFHITLKFLGEVASDRLPELLGVGSPELPSFQVELARAAVWDNGVAVLQGQSPELQALHERLDRTLQQLGFAKERRAYRPHVTLARNAKSARLPKPTSITLRVSAFCLAASDPAKPGIYRVLGTFPLTAGPP